MLSIGGVLLLAATGGYLLQGDSSNAAPDNAKHQATTPAAPRPNTHAHVWSSRADQGQRPQPHLNGLYTISYETTITPDGASTPMRIAFEATLAISPTRDGLDATDATDARHAWSTAQAYELSLNLDEQAKAQLSDLPNTFTEEAFAPSMRVAHSPQGHLAKVRFAPSSPQSARAAWHGLLASVQLVSPSQAHPLPNTWTTSEEDLNAKLNATYTLDHTHDLHKRWQSFTEPNLPKLYTASGHATFSLSDDAQHILSARAEQLANIDVTGSGRPLKISTRISIQRTGDAGDIATPSTETMQPYEPSKHLPLTPEQRDQQMIAGRSFEQLNNTLIQHSNTKHWQLRTSTRRDLAAYMRLNPEAVHTVADKLIQGVEHEPLRRSYIEALASVPTPESHQRLIDIASDRKLPHELRMQTTQALALTGQPSQPLVLGLLALAQSQAPEDRGLQDTALVSAGAAARHLSQKNPAQGGPIISDLIDKADEHITTAALAKDLGIDPGDNTERRIVAWLSALGNTQSEDILPTLTRATNAKSSWIRQSAYHAMRNLPGQEAGLLVSDAIRNDPHASVRRDAIKTAKLLGPERCLDATEHALLKDKRALVRMEAANTIGAWLIHAPHLRAIFERALQDEEEDYIRDAMRNYMRPDPRLKALPNPPLP